MRSAPQGPGQHQRKLKNDSPMTVGHYVHKTVGESGGSHSHKWEQRENDSLVSRERSPHCSQNPECCGIMLSG